MKGFAVWPALLAFTLLSVETPAQPIEQGGFRLSDSEFWRLTEQLSEPDGQFISDNLVSNELSFAQVVPQLADRVRRGGAYLGVGPEQNFTYMAASEPSVAFILDIRRVNLVVHLMYKALFSLAANRADFVGRLFTRPRPADLNDDANAADLFRAYERVAPGDGERHRHNSKELIDELVQAHGFALSPTDIRTLEQVYRTFWIEGPSIDYATSLLGQRPDSPASYAKLMTQTGVDGRGLSYLATEQRYRTVKALQAGNAVVPVVGNFAGPKAVRAIGTYLSSVGQTVAMFYVSNVEDYLGRERIPQNGRWADFCRNVATLPVDGFSAFVRPVGIAAVSADGSLQLSSKIILSTAAPGVVTYRAGEHPTMPLALSPITTEVAQCR